jgi:hypothetical protein
LAYVTLTGVRVFLENNEEGSLRLSTGGWLDPM